MRKQSVLESIKKEFEHQSVQVGNKYSNIPEELIWKYFSYKAHLDRHADVKAETRTVVPLDRELIALDQERQKRISTEIKPIEQDYQNKRNIQNAIAMNLSRLSPVSCYTYLVCGLSNTGVTEFDKFMENAQRYQDEVEETIYDKYQVRFYKSELGSGFQTSNLGSPDAVPDIHYQYTSSAEALQAGWVDIMLLLVFNLLFFSLAFVKFGRYDVR